MDAIKNICLGDYSRLKNPILSTMLLNIINIVPFALSIEAINVIFKYFSHIDTELNTTRLWQIFIIMLLYTTIMALAERKAYRANFRGAYNMSADGRIRFAEHLRKLPLGFLNKYDPADLSSMLITDFTMAETSISHHLPQLLGAIVMPLLAFLGLIWIDWRMATAMFISLPIAVFIIWITDKIQSRLSEKQIAAKVNAAARIEEYLQGIRIIKSYNLEGEKFNRLKKAFLCLKKESIKQEAVLGPFILLAISIIRSGLTLMILVGTYFFISGSLDIITFVMFLVIGSRIFDPLSIALTNFMVFRYNSIAGGRILSVMNTSEQEQITFNGTKENKTTISPKIEFIDVCFAYNDSEVLHNINLQFKENTLTALVGKSGSGKSTIMELIARFYDTNKGEILLNNVPIKSLNMEELMKHISMVFQDVYLFKDTIYNNIKFGNPNASETEIINAAKSAMCHDFITQLPRGYDTLIGEGGNTLSGGEKQRISIARAMLKNADIVLLDEATSYLDAENEVEVQKAISNLIKEKTVIVIAHRLNTIVHADNIVVIDEGKIVEQGSHEQLIQNEGLYKRLFYLQQQ